MDDYSKLLQRLSNFEKEVMESNDCILTKEANHSMVTSVRESVGNYIAPFKFLEFWSKEE